MQQGYSGISFPFRIGNKGGVVMSSTDPENVQHIEEAIQQILLTRFRERGMEFSFGSDIDSDIFEPNDIDTRNLIEYQVREALRDMEDRIEVISVNIYSKDSSVFADIKYTVPLYNSDYSTQAKLGGV